MAASGQHVGLLLVAFTLANLPWLSERFLLVKKLNKTAGLRWLEWLMGYFAAGFLAMALEYKLTGLVYPQQWEFYVATFCLFIVFALPGFIYHYDLKKLLNG